MKVFVTGANGRLGRDVLNELAKRGYCGIGSGRTPIYNGDIDSIITYVAMDITNTDSVHDTLRALKPDAVIHCAAWTDVDAAEKANLAEKVYKINIDGTKNIAEACRELDCKMMYISTEYVFNGKGEIPWTPDCTEWQPLNVYGQSKLGGELAVSMCLTKYFIIRTSWLFGENGVNFVKTMLNLGKKHSTICVVNDQVGTPTYTPDLAQLLVDMIETDKYGYYHATNEGGYISRYDYACEIFRKTGYSTAVIPVSTIDCPHGIRNRPLNGRLDKVKLLQMGFAPLPDWRDALSRFLKLYKGF